MAACYCRLLGPTIMRLVIGGHLGLLSSGCALIEEVRGDGTTRRTIAVASPINVEPSPPGRGRVVRISGVGFAAFDEALTLGVFSNSQIVPDPTCQIVLVGNTDEQLERFAALIDHSPNVCADNASAGEKQ